MRLNCFIEQELVGIGFTDVAITYYFLRTAIDLIQAENRVAAHRVATLFFVSGIIVK